MSVSSQKGLEGHTSLQYQGHEPKHRRAFGNLPDTLTDILSGLAVNMLKSLFNMSVTDSTQPESEMLSSNRSKRRSYGICKKIVKLPT
jgi:hypothetical protein